jgi:hypothetical protein
MKKVKFKSVDVGLQINHPQPASKLIPQWFKTMPGVSAGFETIKKCIPFLDAMTSGYMIVLSADVYYDKNGFQQISKNTIITKHGDSQIEGFKIPIDYDKKPYKWMNSFIMKTPRGYSTMFVHPINRIELPFYTLSGVVDTDKFELQVNFPFFMKKDFSGIIPAGTPIAQAIPFKRTDWKADVEDQKPVKLPAYRFTMHNPPFGFYKKNFWTRKKYQ